MTGHKLITSKDMETVSTHLVALWWQNVQNCRFQHASPSKKQSGDLNVIGLT